jgi:hypothetical protein
MNFRIPIELKIQFNNICTYKQTKMTNELNKLIEEYINKELPNLNLENQNPTLQIWGHQVYNRLTKVWSVIKGA